MTSNREAAPDLVGRVVGSYKILALLGRGGMGSVYLAEHQAIARKAAIKVLHPDFASRPAIVQRFFNEARAVNLIKHQNIVDVYDFGEAPEIGGYIVMELLEGESLASRLQGGRTLPPRTVARIIGRIALALGAAHARGVVHRDLKPDNVFLVPDADRPGDDRVKVLDFGIAKLRGADSEPGDGVTKTGAVIGTPAYMAPEQCHGAKDVDHRADVYALGVIAFEMLVGRLPFVTDGFGELVAMHLFMEPPALRSINDRVPPEVDAAVMQALRKEPEARPQTAEAFAQLLQVAVDALAPDRPALARAAARSRMTEPRSPMATKSPAATPKSPPLATSIPPLATSTPPLATSTPPENRSDPAALAPTQPEVTGPDATLYVPPTDPDEPRHDPEPSRVSEAAEMPEPMLEPVHEPARPVTTLSGASAERVDEAARLLRPAPPAGRRRLVFIGVGALGLVAAVAGIALLASQDGEDARPAAEEVATSTPGEADVEITAAPAGVGDALLLEASELAGARRWGAAIDKLEGVTDPRAEALRNRLRFEMRQEHHAERMNRLVDAGEYEAAHEEGTKLERGSVYWVDASTLVDALARRHEKAAALAVARGIPLEMDPDALSRGAGRAGLEHELDELQTRLDRIEMFASLIADRSAKLSACWEKATSGEGEAELILRVGWNAKGRITEVAMLDPGPPAGLKCFAGIKGQTISALGGGGEGKMPFVYRFIAPVGGRERAKEDYTKGLRLFAASHEAEAMAAFKKAIKIDPKFPDPHRALGTLYARSGNLKAMCTEFKTYVELNPHAGDTAKIKAEMGKYDATVPECRLGG